MTFAQFLRSEALASSAAAITSPYGENLPIFPTLYGCPGEAEVERVVERLMDRADKALMRGLATQVQYDAWVRALDAWSRTYVEA